jgi:hypothetical protein
MEDRVMASVNGISAVDICADEIAFALVCSKDVGLVGAGVCPQNGILVDIIGVCLASPWVMRWKAERIEVLMCSYHWEERGMVFVGWCGELRLDDGSSYRNGVIFLYM